MSFKKTSTPQNPPGFQQRVEALLAEQETFLTIPNTPEESWGNLYTRWKNPVLTWRHTPVYWRYDLNYQSNPFLLERLGINTVFNAAAMEWEGRIVVMPRIESFDVKSFFAVAESDNGIDNFRFRDFPIVMPEMADPDKNVYDLRLVHHEDGWIYGTFCTERKDASRPFDSSAAIAQCGIARTRDLVNWERLPDLRTQSSQQRNCVLHPEFFDGQYAFYTRPMDGFIDTGGGAGIGWGLCRDINDPVVEKEVIIDPKEYHTVKEVKNGLGPAPLRTEHGWLHLAHGVRRTAAGLRYVLYCFLCDLDEPWRVTHRPGGHFLAPHSEERVGDVSNVVFSNGWVLRSNGDLLIYYASSDTRLHVATTTLDVMLDYVLHTPEDAGRSYTCVQQRIDLIARNLPVVKSWRQQD